MTRALRLLVCFALAVPLALGLVAGCKGDEAECSALDAEGLPRGGAGTPGSGAVPCAKETDCPRSCLCRDLGRCARVESGACVVGTLEHCRASRVCTMVGQCTLEGGTCVAAADADCQRSRTCERSGRCTAEGGICVVRDR